MLVVDVCGCVYLGMVFNLCWWVYLGIVINFVYDLFPICWRRINISPVRYVHDWLKLVLSGSMLLIDLHIYIYIIIIIIMKIIYIAPNPLKALGALQNQ